MGKIMVPSEVRSRLSYAFIVMISSVIIASAHPNYFMNFRVHKFRADPLSIHDSFDGIIFNHDSDTEWEIVINFVRGDVCWSK